MITTINVNAEILNKIVQAAQSNKKSPTEIIIYLLSKVKDDIPEPFIFGRMVKYQDRRNEKDWRTIHLHLRDDEYEYLLDLRRFLKSSVSLLVAIAVQKYLAIVEKLISDNNLLRNYVFILQIIDGIMHWRQIWGYPPNIESFISS